MQGCYWHDRGGPWRQRLEAMTDQEIIERQRELKEEAMRDLYAATPRNRREAVGIWLLARV